MSMFAPFAADLSEGEIVPNDGSGKSLAVSVSGEIKRCFINFTPNLRVILRSIAASVGKCLSVSGQFPRMASKQLGRVPDGACALAGTLTFAHKVVRVLA